ncbi:DUF1206 domain-containing protein [Cryobacterium melibiosiphilum]|uniref:DUF1206 domain-containing protein n=2 Tax=Cryobacterium melibiosiphilum TaxID=995039 RepID=A0A3A5MAC1_9MICO|nr:DUF1206 domain-containing protein [Cryobacterium melibiosiphilum]
MRTRTFRRLARSGYAVNGLIHFLIGTIALTVAFGGTPAAGADQSGALREVAGSPGGGLLIWAAVVGLGALGLWQVTQAGLIVDPNPLKKWGRRASEAGKGIAYLALGFTAMAVALGGRTSSSESIQAVSAWLLESDLGVLLLIAIGLTVFGGGIGFIVIGLRRGFRKFIRVPGGRRGLFVLRLGRSGYIVKGLSLGIIGSLLVVAALTSDAAQAGGLDGALRTLGQLPHGAIYLTIVGLGLAQYGLFLMIRVRLARF